LDCQGEALRGKAMQARLGQVRTDAVLIVAPIGQHWRVYAGAERLALARKD
jgi:hypothetical protein